MFTANVSGQGGTPTGDVTFSEGATTLGVSQLTNGVATLAKSDLSAGAHTIVATYGGDATFETSSASHNHTVSSSTSGDTSTALTSSPNPSVAGQSVAFVATVSGQGGAAAASMMLAAPVNAAGVISVNTVNDEDNTGDSCSLREAIKAANTDAAYGGCTAGSGTDTITLPVGTYTLSLGDQLPPVTSAIVVEGNESIIQAHVDPDTASWRVFEVVNGGDLTLEDLTVRHGYCVNALSCASQDNPDNDKGNGGGIFNGGILTLDNVDITMNSAANGGGGIYHKRGELTVLAGSSSSNFQENSASTDGGGIGSGGSGAISVTQAMFMSNTAGNAGGAIASNSSAARRHGQHLLEQLGRHGQAAAAAPSTATARHTSRRVPSTTIRPTAVVGCSTAGGPLPTLRTAPSTTTVRAAMGAESTTTTIWL